LAALVEDGNLGIDDLDDVAEPCRVILADGDVGVRRDEAVRPDAAEARLRLNAGIRTLSVPVAFAAVCRAGTGASRRQRFRPGRDLQALSRLIPGCRRQLR